MARTNSPWRGWRPVAATFFAVLGLCLSLISALPAHGTPSPPAPSPSPPASTNQALRVEVVDQTPQVLTGRENFEVTVQLVNDSDDDLRDIRLQLQMQTWTPIARSKLEEWIAEPDEHARMVLATSQVEIVQAGGATRVQLRVHGEQLPAMDRGPRGLVVSAECERYSAQATSFLVYWPPSDFPPLRYATLLPLVASADEILAAPTRITTSARAEAIAGLGANRAITLAPDPQFLAGSDLAADSRAQLPSGDPDLQVLTSTNAGKAELAKRDWHTSPNTHLLWWPTFANQATFASAPPDVTIVADDLALTHDMYYTPSALTMIDGHPTVVADSVLSEHLQAAGDFVLHRQALLAHLAATVRERPNDPRLIVLAPSRNIDVTRSQLQEKLRVLADQPWLQATWLPRLVKKDGQATWPFSQQMFLDWQVSEDLSATTPLWDRVVEPVEKMRTLAATTQTPNDVSAPIDMLVTRLLTTALSGHGDARAQLINDITTQSKQVADAIRIETPSSVLLIADTTEIPLTVENALPAAANVRVTFKTTDPRLQPGEQAETQLAANSRTTVRVPVNAVGSGNVWMSVRILDTNGHLVATSPAFEVRVRADWESVGTGIFAALLVAIMIFGLVRTIWQHRKQPRGARRIDQRTPTIPPAHLRTKETKR